MCAPHGAHGRTDTIARPVGSVSAAPGAPPAPRLLPASRRSDPSLPAAPGSARLGGGLPSARGPAPAWAGLARSTGPRAAPALRPSRHLRSPASSPCRARVLSAWRCGHARLPSPFLLQPEPSPCRWRPRVRGGELVAGAAHLPAAAAAPRRRSLPRAGLGGARRRCPRSLLSRAFSSRFSARGTPPATPTPSPLRGRRLAAGTPLPAEVCLRPGQAPAAPRLSAGPPPSSLGARPRLPGGGDSAARRLGGRGASGDAGSGWVPLPFGWSPLLAGFLRSTPRPSRGQLAQRPPPDRKSVV